MRTTGASINTYTPFLICRMSVSMWGHLAERYTSEAKADAILAHTATRKKKRTTGMRQQWEHESFGERFRDALIERLGFEIIHGQHAEHQ